MRFTKKQYEAAIKSLQEASEQLEPDGHCCACCGDSGHQAFECGHNPLFAMALCREIAKDAQKLHEDIHAGKVQNHGKRLHEIIHWLAGFDHRMGNQTGPARVVMPHE